MTKSSFMAPKIVLKKTGDSWKLIIDFNSNESRFFGNREILEGISFLSGLF